VPVLAAAVCLPGRRHAEEAEPNPEGLGVRCRAPGPAVIGEEHGHGRGKAVTRHGLPQGAQPAPNLAREGARKKHMREGVVVGRPTRGVRAESVGRGDRHADIPLEGSCEDAAVQNPPGAGSLHKGQATMRNRPPHVVPGGAKPAVARRSEDVRAVCEASPRGPAPPALERFPGGYAFCDGWAGHRRVSRSRGGGCGGIAFSVTPFARKSGAGGGSGGGKLTFLRRPKSCERRGSRVPVVFPNRRPDGQAGCVSPLCLPKPDVPLPLSGDGGGEGEDGGTAHHPGAKVKGPRMLCCKDESPGCGAPGTSWAWAIPYIYNGRGQDGATPVGWGHKLACGYHLAAGPISPLPHPVHL
jgi:hypothetical protein